MVVQNLNTGTSLLPGEIAGVQRATVQFIEDAAAEKENDFLYVLVPFNDPGETF